MVDSKYMIPYTKSHISFYDLSKSASPNHFIRNQSLQINCVEGSTKSSNCNNMGSKSAFYITSEQYNVLTNDSNCKTLAPSTSTIFYDLDDVARRRSFHSLTALGESATNLMKVMKENIRHNIFSAKSNVIVQECATQMHPKFLPCDSIEINAKKVRKKFSKGRILSSKIILRDNYDEINYYLKHKSNNKQKKYWSYAKYRTEYTKPILEEKKSKKEEKIKLIVDPCPCQLFSYACPCTGNKSLTELTRMSTRTLTHQITSTSNINVDEKKDEGSSKNKIKKRKRDKLKDHKLTNTSVAKLIEAIVPKNEPVMDVPNKQEPPSPDQSNDNKNCKKNNKSKLHKKCRKVFCPNCKEEVDVMISVSTTEEEECIEYDNSMLYHSNEIPSTTAYTYKSSPNNHKIKPIDDDSCLHDPPCEMLPICQILPNDNNYVYDVNQKCAKKPSVPKPAQRVIRITKACRHHPPCTVVPSCQRANVLKNNCEFIPPCLHHPRCVNLPLCVPYSKHLPYKEAPPKLADEMENSEHLRISRCKYIPVCQCDSLDNIDHHQINVTSRMQNVCEFLKDYNTSKFLLNPKTTCVCNSYSPYQISGTTCHMCQSNKSCQFDRPRCKNIDNKEPSTDTVVYIRNVACQFRTTNDSPKNSVKSYSPKNSLLQSKSSSNSFEFVDGKQMSNYYTNIHTLRYEDKSTNPISGAENSFSTVSITSIDSECPSHGRRDMQLLQRKCPATGFHPQSAYVAAFSSVKKTDLTKCNEVNKLTAQEFRECHKTFSMKSHRGYIKDKYKKMISVKRRRKSRHNNNLLKCFV